MSESNKSEPAPTGPVSRIEFETALLRQEHRLLAILRNFFLLRRDFPKGDPRRDAVTEALLWRISVALMPVITAGGAGIFAIAGIIVAIWANKLISEQNASLAKQTLLAETQTQILQSQTEKLDQQNSLLEKQNESVSIQNQLAEANRRSAHVGELSAIFDRIDTFITAWKKSNMRAFETGWVLPPHLYGRIAALSRSLRPYQYVRPKESDLDAIRRFPEREVLDEEFIQRQLSKARDSLTPVSLSPERAELLISLIDMNVDLKPLLETKATFDFADFRGANLAGARLSGLSFRGADFSRANLEGADLKGTNLEGTTFAVAYLKNADLRNTQLDGVNSTTYLRDANVTGAHRLDWAPESWLLHGAVFDSMDVLRQQFCPNQSAQKTFDNAYRVETLDDGKVRLIGKKPSAP